MEYRNTESIIIENTRFIYRTNLSGDPQRDNFGSDARKCNIVIPDYDLAMRMIDDDFNVKETKPRAGEEEDFVPEFFVSVRANYDTGRPPIFRLVSGDSKPVTLDEESVALVDKLADDKCIGNVNATLNPYINKTTGRKSLYIKVMYVEQDFSSDPFASRYYDNID